MSSAIEQCIKLAGWESTGTNPNDLEPLRKEARAELEALKEAQELIFANGMGVVPSVSIECPGCKGRWTMFWTGNVKNADAV